MTTKTLLMIAAAPVEPLAGDRFRLDAKFVEGMCLHVVQWGGPVRVLLWRGGAIPFGTEVAAADLGFELVVLAPGEMVTRDHVAGAGIVAASSDLHQVFDLPTILAGTGVPLVYVIEYTLGAHLKVVWLERRSALRKLRSTLWHLGKERKRRVALRAADALQFNGWPAQAAYERFTRDGLLYLDGRMRSNMMATSEEMAARTARLQAGAPLRIIHSGRLEPMKGAQDLIPVAQALAKRGVAFTLDIWGTGSLVPEVRSAIRVAGLEDRVRLHDPVPFEEVLVPRLRADADLFLSCHRQSDPSCSYLEAMGCGLAVVGYDNEMWARLAMVSGGGRVVPMRDTDSLAAAIADWATNRAALIAAGERALAYARAHDFETEFARRMEHLSRVAAA